MQRPRTCIPTVNDIQTTKRHSNNNQKRHSIFYYLSIHPTNFLWFIINSQMAKRKYLVEELKTIEELELSLLTQNVVVCRTVAKMSSFEMQLDSLTEDENKLFDLAGVALGMINSDNVIQSLDENSLHSNDFEKSKWKWTLFHRMEECAFNSARDVLLKKIEENKFQFLTCMSENEIATRTASFYQEELLSLKRLLLVVREDPDKYISEHYVQEGKRSVQYQHDLKILRQSAERAVNECVFKSETLAEARRSALEMLRIEIRALRAKHEQIFSYVF